jgi:hypothetical protein
VLQLWEKILELQFFGKLFVTDKHRLLAGSIQVQTLAAQVAVGTERIEFRGSLHKQSGND